MAFRTLDDLGDIKGKRVFVRVDLNVPMADGRVTDETRLRALLPTVSELADKGAKVLLLAHFGRPKGAKHSEMSVSMVLDALQAVLGREVMFVPEIAGDVVAQSVGILADGDIALLENTRFWPGEEQNDPELARAVRWAQHAANRARHHGRGRQTGSPARPTQSGSPPARPPFCPSHHLRYSANWQHRVCCPNQNTPAVDLRSR